MILQEGDIVHEIIATSETLGALMFHRGILLPDETICHFTDHGVVVEPLDKFYAHRHAVSVKAYTIQQQVDIEELVEYRNKTKGTFHLVTNNCEHFSRWFLNEYTNAKRNPKISPQVMFVAGALSVTFLYKVLHNSK